MLQMALATAASAADPLALVPLVRRLPNPDLRLQLELSAGKLRAKTHGGARQSVKSGGRASDAKSQSGCQSAAS